jgi:hypothetical protein
MKFTFHVDPGHGWLEVPRHMVETIASQISACSYESRDGKTVYLEEDCDAAVFARHLEAKGQTLEYEEKIHTTDAFIRRLPSFKTGWKTDNNEVLI